MHEEWERALPSATDIASLLIWLRERKPQRSGGWDLIARRDPDTAETHAIPSHCAAGDSSWQQLAAA